MPSKVQIDLVATDLASPTLDKVRQQLEMFPTFARAAGAVGPEVDKASKSFADFDISASKATRAIRGLAVPLISELTPALGGTASAMGGVVSSALLLGSGMGALAIAAAALAGIVGGKLLSAWQESRAAAEQFHRTMQSGDLTRVTGQVETLSQKIVKLSEDIQEAKKKTDPTGLGLGLFGAGAQDLLEMLGVGRKSQLGKSLAEQEAARNLAAKLKDVEVPGGTDADLQKALGVILESRFATQQAQRGFGEFRLPGPEAQLADALRRAADLEAGSKGAPADPVAAANLRAEAQAQFQRIKDLTAAKMFGPVTPGAVSDYEGDFFGEGGQGVARELTERLRDIERQREMDLLRNRGDVLGEDAVSDYAGQPFGQQGRAEAAVAIQQTTTNELNRQLEITQQLATLNATRTDLTLEQREALSLQAIEQERILKLQIAGKDQAKQFAAEIEATIKRQQVLEATDPVAGLKRGLANVEIEGSLGLRMQSAMANIGSGMARTLDDTFFSTITGKFEDLPGIAQRFGADMVRAFTGELAKMATAAIFGQLRSSFESLFPGGGTAGSLPFGAGSGGGPAGYAAGGGSGGGPLLTASGRPLSQSEIDAAYAAGGDAGVRALRSGEGTVVGGEFIGTGAGMEQVTAGAGLLTRAPSGFTWRQGLGIAGSAALLGLTAYGATGAQSTGDVVTSGVVGALAGATLGGQLGGLGGYGGTGAAVGAVAGAAIAGTIALLAKQQADKEAKKARQAAEVERAAGAGSDLVRSAAGSTSLADFFRRLTAFGSGYTGGTANPAVSTAVMTPQGEKAIGIENPYYPVATLQDLLAAPETLRAGIQAGVNPDLLAGPNAATSTALQAIAKDLVDQFRTAEQGVGLTQEDQVGGLTRRTTFPASRADMLDPNRDVEIDELALAELSEEDRALLQLELLSRVAVETDFVSTISDGATGQIVSITRIARSTIGLPGITTPTGLTPEAAAAIGTTAALNIPRFTEPPPARTPIYELGSPGEGQAVLPYLTGYTPPTAEALAAYEARRNAFYQPYVEQLAASSKDVLAALSLPQIQASINAGLLTPAAVAALSQAGLLPQVRAILPPELQAALDAVTSPGGGDGVSDPGIDPDAPSLSISQAISNLGDLVSLPSDVSTAISNAINAQGLANLSLNALGANPTVSFGPQGFSFSMTSNTGPNTFGISLGDLASFALGFFGFQGLDALGGAIAGLGQGSATRGGDFSGVFGGLFGGTASPATANFSGVNQSLSDSLRGRGQDEPTPDPTAPPTNPDPDPTNANEAPSDAGTVGGIGDK